MKSEIYHTGLTPPRSVKIDGFEIFHYPVLKVDYESNNVPQDIRDILQLDPIVLMMSKNAVLGLQQWISHFDLESDFFSDTKIWTVGDRTHACLKDILGIQSYYPNEMTGKGVTKALHKQNHFRVLLISGYTLRQEFIDGLSLVGVNFFHFPVYKTTCVESIEFSTHFKNAESNYLIITSPSGVDGILKSLSLSDLSKMKNQIISIGPTTSAAIRQKCGDVFLESEVQNIMALYDNLKDIILKSSYS